MKFGSLSEEYSKQFHGAVGGLSSGNPFVAALSAASLPFVPVTAPLAAYVRTPFREWLRPENTSVTDKDAMSARTADFISDLLMASIPNPRLSPKRPAMSELDVFHGSPHKWLPEEGFSKGRPRLDKIGTGEGSQAFGWGMYFAENPKVAGEYLRAGRNLGFENWDDVGRLANKAFAQASGDTNKALEILDDAIAKTRGDTKRLNLRLAKKTVAEGNLDSTIYKLDLPDNKVSELLDWDAPLSQQPENVKKALERGGYMISENADITGRELYNFIARDTLRFQAPQGSAAQAASEHLKSIGIPGLKFFDQGSRKGVQGTRNFVIWDQGLLDKMEIK